MFQQYWVLAKAHENENGRICLAGRGDTHQPMICLRSDRIEFEHIEIAAQQLVEFLSTYSSTQLVARRWRNAVVALWNRQVLCRQHEIATGFKKVCNLGNERLQIGHIR